jgi:hypothetical protein
VLVARLKRRRRLPRVRERQARIDLTWQLLSTGWQWTWFSEDSGLWVQGNGGGPKKMVYSSPVPDRETLQRWEVHQGFKRLASVDFEAMRKVAREAGVEAAHVGMAMRQIVRPAPTEKPGRGRAVEL